MNFDLKFRIIRDFGSQQAFAKTFDLDAVYVSKRIHGWAKRVPQKYRAALTQAFGKRFADRVLGRDGEERRCMAPARHLGKRSRDVGSAARPVSEGAEKTPAHRGRASGPQ